MWTVIVIILLNSFFIKDIENYRELREVLTTEIGDDMSALFTRISIYESGWHYESYLGNELNNIFAFVCNPKCKCDTSTGYAKFDSKRESIEFLKWWIQYSPPNENENLLDWLARRGYNSVNPKYYDYLTHIYID